MIKGKTVFVGYYKNKKNLIKLLKMAGFTLGIMAIKNKENITSRIEKRI